MSDTAEEIVLRLETLAVPHGGILWIKTEQQLSQKDFLHLAQAVAQKRAEMKSANGCDECSRERNTLYEMERRLICLMCLPVSSLYGIGALRAIKSSVTGVINIERRRRRLKSN